MNFLDEDSFDDVLSRIPLNPLPSSENGGDFSVEDGNIQTYTQLTPVPSSSVGE